MSATPTFGQWLKQRRKALGLKQKELAQQAGCAEITLRKIEAGDLQPSAALVASLARVFGAAEVDLPALVSLARGTDDDFTARARLLRPRRPHNLPAQLTPLIGRDQDVAAVRKRLLSDGARLITLLGPPGVGKTRLALAVAEDVLEQFEHGAFFVRLGPVSDPALVAAAIAQALGMEMSGPNPPELQLRAWLEEKHLLLVLDNFEQIVAAAPLVDDLLRRCPWLHVLVTSRQPLRVRGERQMTVRPLALPVAQPGGGRLTADDALRYAAVVLFAERAEAVQPDFAVSDDNAAAVAELCRRLDGLPLAIELVAARIKLLPPADLLLRLRGPWLLSTDGLRDVSERQRTLRGAIGWSYDLLTPVEQTLFTRLAVFVGGCTLEASEMMCEDALSPAQVIDGIASLLNKSLLHREAGLYGETRYAMLETVREYGLERLAGTEDEEALRERHARCCLRLIENAEQTKLDPGWIRVRQMIDDDLHNVRAALEWAMQHDTQAALLLVTAQVERLSTQGPYAEGLQLIDAVFALPGASAHTITRARALYEAGILVLFCGDPGKAQAFEEESLAISEEVGYGKGQADALIGLGRVANSGWWDQEAARTYFERALESYRNLQEATGQAYATVLLAMINYWQGDFTQARILCDESLLVAKRAGFSWAWPLVLLSHMDLDEGDLDRAKSMCEQALVILRPQGSTVMISDMLKNLGIIATCQGDFSAAHTFLHEALVVRRKLGKTDSLVQVYLAMAELHQAESNYDRAVQSYQQILGYVVRNQTIWSSVLVSLATLSGKLDQHELVARILGTIDAVVETTGNRLSPVECQEVDRRAGTVRSLLGAAQFDAAWTAGREQEFRPAVEEALSILEATPHILGPSR